MREKMLHDETFAIYNAEQEDRTNTRAEIIEKMRASGMTNE